MANDDKSTVNIVLALVGCLGCGVVLFLLVAFFGVGFFFSPSLPAMPSMPPPVSPPPLAPTPPVAPTPPTTPAGWSEYVHSAACPGNDNLRLTHFRASYPSTFTVLPCQDQEPRPWAYVTFHLEDAAGAADQQFTLGHSRGLPTQQMLADVGAQLVQQLGAPAPRLLDSAPFAARGQSLMRRDSVFTIPAEEGIFAPGLYVLRQVVVPGASIGAEGLTITMMHRVDSTELEALSESEPILLSAANSIQF